MKAILLYSWSTVSCASSCAAAAQAPTSEWRAHGGNARALACATLAELRSEAHLSKTQRFALGKPDGQVMDEATFDQLASGKHELYMIDDAKLTFAQLVSIHSIIRDNDPSTCPSDPVLNPIGDLLTCRPVDCLRKAFDELALVLRFLVVSRLQNIASPDLFGAECRMYVNNYANKDVTVNARRKTFANKVNMVYFTWEDPTIKVRLNKKYAIATTGANGTLMRNAPDYAAVCSNKVDAFFLIDGSLDATTLLKHIEYNCRWYKLSRAKVQADHDADDARRREDIEVRHMDAAAVCSRRVPYWAAAQPVVDLIAMRHWVHHRGALVPNPKFKSPSSLTPVQMFVKFTADVKAMLNADTEEIIRKTRNGTANKYMRMYEDHKKQLRTTN